MEKITIVDDAFISSAVEMDCDENVPFCNNLIMQLITNDVWKDLGLKELINQLNKERFFITGYTNPEIFRKDLEKGYCPEIIIFDWDYNTPSELTKDHLKYILESRYCFIYIYSGCDKEDEINTMLEEDFFCNYLNRIKFFPKEKAKIDEIISKIKELKSNNFSFRFGTKIRIESLNSIDKILIHIGKLGIDSVSKLLNIHENNSNDIIEFIGERFKTHLLNLDFNNELENKIDNDDNIIDIGKELWKYRLYFHPNDNIVRKGDIIFHENKYFFVITPDCELHRFWEKTLGNLNLIEMMDINEKQELKNQLITAKSPSNLKKMIRKVTSISNDVGLPSSPILFPFVLYNNKELNLLLFPKQILFKKIDRKDSVNRDSILLYDYLQDYERIITLGEPFLTPVLEHIYSALKGFGAPDFPNQMQKQLKRNIEEIFNE